MNSGYPKSTRLLKLLFLLSGPYKRTTTELECILEIQERTLFRYLKELKILGFDIVNKRGYVYLNAENESVSVISKLLQITASEAEVMNKVLYSINAPREIKQNIQKKIGIFNQGKVLEEQVKAQQSQLVETIHSAIKNHNKVLFQNYASSHRGEVSDRMVEPFEFKNNFQYVMCFDCDDKQNKLFKISRIGEALLVKIAWEYKHEHNSLPTDIFRICGEFNKYVKLELTLLARNLLIEEFPSAESCVKKQDNNTYIFECKVAGFQGVSRFCMGLPDQVKIIESEELKSYIHNRKKNNI